MTDPKEGGTVIGHDTVIKGEMTVESQARILGRFEGMIVSKGKIEIADKAQCMADVEAGIVLIDGNMQGNITVSDKLQLNATANMKGDVQAAKLMVADGARLDGHFRVGIDAVRKGDAPAHSTNLPKQRPVSERPGQADPKSKEGGAGA
ncbi:MAG: polymer-forming cytoskeletal protein [Planctomycetota bacterium]